MSDRRPMATTEEVAAFLQLPPKTLAVWRSNGTGPKFIKVGKHVRYLWSDVESELARLQAGPAARGAR